MVDRPTYNQGSLFLNFTTPTASLSITLDIPPQTIKLIGYRIEMATIGDSLAEKVLYLDIPRIYNINKVIDNNMGHTYLPIMLDNAVVTFVTGIAVPISMQHHLPETFVVRLLNSSYTPVADLVSASFMFEVSYGHSV